MKTVTVFVAGLFLACALSGCAKLAHLQELLTLKGLSDNQAAQQKYVEKQDKRFEQLLEAVKANRMNEFSDQKAFLKAFGEPIFKKSTDTSGQKWLYRYTAKLFGSEKVYLYFDQSGKLLNYEHVKPNSNKGNL